MHWDVDFFQAAKGSISNQTYNDDDDADADADDHDGDDDDVDIK